MKFGEYFIGEGFGGGVTAKKQPHFYMQNLLKQFVP